MKKASLSILLFALLLLLTGCNKDKTQDTISNDEPTTLTMWSIATESDSAHNAFMSAIADYEAAHENVKIEMETFENESYKTKIKSAVAANELPDIFFTWGGGFSSSFVDADKVLELDSYYENYKDELPKSALKYASYNDKIYGVTYITPISVIFYNKAMFEEHNLEQPKTFDDLLSVCQTFIDKGITPFGTSVKEAWVLAMFNDALTLKCVGDDTMANAFMRKGQRYQDDGFIDAANKMQQLFDLGAFSESAAGISNDEAVATFLNGTVPMFVTGSWLGSQITGDADNPDDYDAMPFPACSENAEITDFMGGSVDVLMVNAESKQKDLAANAAFEISKYISKYGYLDGIGIAAWKVDYDVSSLGAITMKLADFVNTGTSFTVWSGSLMEADDYSEYQILLQEFFVGNLDAQGFVNTMDSQLTPKE